MKLGEIIIEKYKVVEQECKHCDEPAEFKLTFLLKGSRNNPNSQAYGKDDCSWCEDDHTFSCAEHKDAVRTDPDYALNDLSWCATFERAKGFEHMFLHKEKIKEIK